MNEAQRRAFTKNSECRSKLNDLQTAAEPDAAAIETAAKAHADSEVELRAALATDDGGEVETVEVDAEVRERIELRSRSRFSTYLTAAVEGTNVAGAEAEYNAAVGVKPGFMPADILLDEPEQRAVTTVPTTGDYQGAQASVIQPVFERTASAAIGVQFPMVEQGTALYPAISTAPPAGVKAKSAAADATAAAFTLATRTPRRVTGRFTVRAEDTALFPPMEAALRTAMVGAAGSAVDEQVFNGAASDFTTDGEIRGLFAQATDVTATSTTETFGTGVSRFAALVDGEYAYGWGDVRGVIGSATFAAYAALFQSNGDMSLYDYLAGKLGGIRVSNRVPTVASTAQKGIVSLNATGQAILVPVWRQIQLIRDPYSESGKGETHVTGILLIGSPFVPHGTSQIKEVHPKLS